MRGEEGGMEEALNGATERGVSRGREGREGEKEGLGGQMEGQKDGEGDWSSEAEMVRGVRA